MQVSAGKKFFALYRKEMRDILPELIVVAAIAIVFTALVYINSPQMPQLVMLPLLMATGLAVFLPFISSFKLLWREFNNNTIYLIMSLPVKGGTVLGSKLAALLSQYLLGILVVVITGLTIVVLQAPQLPAGVDISKRVWDMVSLGLLAFLLSMLTLAYLISTSFFSQLVGKMASRFSGLLTAVVFFVALSLGGKLMDWGRTLFDYHFLTNRFQAAIYFHAGINNLQQAYQGLILQNTIMFITALLFFALAVAV